VWPNERLIYEGLPLVLENEERERVASPKRNLNYCPTCRTQNNSVSAVTTHDLYNLRIGVGISKAANIFLSFP